MTAIGVSTAFEKGIHAERMFYSVITVFFAEIYVNDFFLFFKNYF